MLQTQVFLSGGLVAEWAFDPIEPVKGRKEPLRCIRRGGTPRAAHSSQYLGAWKAVLTLGVLHLSLPARAEA